MRAPTRVLVAAAPAAYPLIRRAALTWGAGPGDVDAALPGDSLVPDADVVATRAVRIDAAPGDVWPWLVQLGYGRGGFYSYDRLEQLAGLDIRSADRIEQRWQDLAVGDAVELAEGFGLPVAELEPASHLVLHSGAPVGGDGEPVQPPMPATPGPPFDFSWAFVLRPDDGGSRLLVRERYRAHSWAGRAVVEVVQPVSWLMTQKMLRGVRSRAERRAPRHR